MEEVFWNNLNSINEEIKKIKKLKEDLDENVFSRNNDILDYRATENFFDEQIHNLQLKYQKILLNNNNNLKYVSYAEKQCIDYMKNCEKK